MKKDVVFLSKKFHVDFSTSTATACKEGSCVHEDDMSNVFPSLEDALRAIDKNLEEQISSVSDRDKTLSHMQKVLEGRKILDKTDTRLTDLYNNVFKVRRDQVKQDRGSTVSREWFDEVQDYKTEFYNLRSREQQILEIMGEHDFLAYKAELKEKAIEEGRRNPPEKESSDEKAFYNYHPKIKTEASRGNAAQSISALTGIPEEEVFSQVREKMLDGLDETEAFRAVFAETGVRTDKPITVIDLETASNPKSSVVDTGSLSYIIEVGIHKYYPDGREEVFSELYDVPQTFKSLHGTGVQDVHHITPEMVAGKTIFVEDEDAQKRVLELLDGSVMVAHNASYENGQLSHNLYGFNRLVHEGRIEILDTEKICRFFCPETENNRNKSFVNNVGIPYEGAHRALADAEMTARALFRLKGDPRGL